MKNFKNIFILTLGFFLLSCEDFLDREPSAIETGESLFLDAENAIAATNAVYDAFAWDEANFGASHTYLWIYGDVMSDDATKGGPNESDLVTIWNLETWSANEANDQSRSEWINKFASIYRANNVITNLDVEEDKFGNKELQDRLVGEAKFMRALAYFHMAKLFGPLPLMTAPTGPSEWGTIERAPLGDVFKLVYEDLNDAITKLPLKSAYAPEDLGRATQGAARAILARAYAFEVSMFGGGSPNNVTWQMVYDQTAAIINSGQYALESNYARVFEEEAENGIESVFELQFAFNSATYGQEPTGAAENAGTINTVIQGSRDHYGWGFNMPTYDLYQTYEAGDPRREATIARNGEGVYGEEFKVSVEYGGVGHNRKYLEPNSYSDGGNSWQNIMIERYADVLLMHAEAAAHLNNLGEAVEMVNMIRQRARNSTYPKGYNIGSNTFDPVPGAEAVPSLQDLSAGIAQADLIDLIKLERRKELAMEGYRYYDILRWGDLLDAYTRKYVEMDGKDHDLNTAENTDGLEVYQNAELHALQGVGDGKIYPVLPIPQGEVSQWNLGQNPNY